MSFQTIGGKVKTTPASYRSRPYLRISLARFLKLAVFLLLVKIFGEIVYECRRYFPADFDSAFLMGRKETFVGTYRVAFYTHIISSPLAVLIGSVLIFSGSRLSGSRLSGSRLSDSRLSGRRGNYRNLHRNLGRFQIYLVLFAVAPSGLVMALQAYTGAIAASGFIAHSIATAACAIAAIRFAVKRNFPAHQKWATRCFVLLCSPLFLRLIAGTTIVTGTNNDWTYRLTAWLSWLIPLVTLECWYRFSTGKKHSGVLISKVAA